MILKICERQFILYIFWENEYIFYLKIKGKEHAHRCMNNVRKIYKNVKGSYVNLSIAFPLLLVFPTYLH